MNPKQNISLNHKTLPLPGNYVKSRIIGSGVKLKVLAAEAGIKPSTLTHYLVGDTMNHAGQRNIFQAFRRLTGLRIRFADFWGQLASKRSA